MLSVIDSLVLTLTTRILILRTSLWNWLDGSRSPSVKKLTPGIPQVNGLPAKPGFTNHTHQPPPGIGRQWIPMVEPIGIDNERLVRSQNAEVRIESESDLSLLAKAGQPCWPFRHPPRNLRQRVVSAAGFGPDDREAQLK